MDLNQIFFDALGGINSLVGSWGVAMIIFTILIRLLLTPLDYKSRVSMRKTQKLAPMQQALQKKYANDKDKLNQKMAELYKKEHINPLSSCLPMLLTWPILIIVFGAMRMAANTEMLEQVGRVLSGQDPRMETFLWIKNLWMPDNLFKAAMPDAATLRQIPLDQWERWVRELQDPQILEALKNLPLGAVTKENYLDRAHVDIIARIIDGYIHTSYYAAYDMSVAQNVVGTIPLLGWQMPKLFNGWLLLPTLSAVSQIVMTKITTGNQPQPQPAANGQPNTGKFMQWFFPIFSFVICLGYSAIFSLYWVTGNLVMMVQTKIINNILDKKEQMAAPVAGEGSVK